MQAQASQCYSDCNPQCICAMNELPLLICYLCWFVTSEKLLFFYYSDLQRTGKYEMCNIWIHIPLAAKHKTLWYFCLLTVTGQLGRALEMSAENSLLITTECNLNGFQLSSLLGVSGSLQRGDGFVWTAIIHTCCCVIVVLLRSDEHMWLRPCGGTKEACHWQSH